jgi:hypothetical protein
MTTFSRLVLHWLAAGVGANAATYGLPVPPGTALLIRLGEELGTDGVASGSAAAFCAPASLYSLLSLLLPFLPSIPSTPCPRDTALGWCLLLPPTCNSPSFVLLLPAAGSSRACAVLSFSSMAGAWLFTYLLLLPFLPSGCGAAVGVRHLLPTSACTTIYHLLHIPLLLYPWLLVLPTLLYTCKTGSTFVHLVPVRICNMFIFGGTGQSAFLFCDIPSVMQALAEEYGMVLAGPNNERGRRRTNGRVCDDGGGRGVSCGVVR